MRFSYNGKDIELKLGGKYTGMTCPYCGSENCWATDYVGFGVPNTRCKTCGAEWLVSPMSKLYIRKGDMENEVKQR